MNEECHTRPAAIYGRHRPFTFPCYLVGLPPRRAALAAGGPDLQLTPLHTYLLSRLADELQQQVRQAVGWGG